MTSSASYPGFSTTGMRSASSTSLIRLTWPRNGFGVSDRPALYSGVERRVRNECRDTSNATTMCVGCSSRSMLISIDVKPNTALVAWPVWVEKFSTGSA